MAKLKLGEIAKIVIDVENRTITSWDSRGKLAQYQTVGTPGLPRYAKSSPAGLLIQCLVKMLDGRIKEYV